MRSTDRRRRLGVECPNTDMRPVCERLAERSYTDLRTGCTVWTGGRLHFGHGTISVLGKKTLVHRAAWESVNGPIPPGVNCLHRCDNPPCWNVDHLFLGTQVDNVIDRDQKGRHRVVTGEAHGLSKLTERQVKAIRLSQRKQQEIADQFGVSKSNVFAIRARKTWRHIP